MCHLHIGHVPYLPACLSRLASLRELYLEDVAEGMLHGEASTLLNGALPHLAQLSSLCITAGEESAAPHGIVSLRTLADLPSLRRCFLGAGSIEASDESVPSLPAGRWASTLQFLAASGHELLLLSELLQAASCLGHVVVLGIPGDDHFVCSPFLWVWARYHPPLNTLKIQLDSSGSHQMSFLAVRHMLRLKSTRPALHIDVDCEAANDCAYTHFAHPISRLS